MQDKARDSGLGFQAKVFKTFNGVSFSHRVSPSLLGPIDPSFRTLSGRLNFTVRRHMLTKDYLFFAGALLRWALRRRRRWEAVVGRRRRGNHICEPTFDSVSQMRSQIFGARIGRSWNPPKRPILHPLNVVPFWQTRVSGGPCVAVADGSRSPKSQTLELETETRNHRP